MCARGITVRETTDALFVSEGFRVSRARLGRFFARRHRVRCGGRHGRPRRRNHRCRRDRGDRAARGGPFAGCAAAAITRRQGRGARLHGHGMAGPTGTVEGTVDHGARRSPARPGRGVPGRAVRVPGAVHAARRVAHVVQEGRRRLVQPDPLPAAAGRVPEAGVPPTAARPVRGQHQQAAVRVPAELPEAPDAVLGQPERGLSVLEHIRSAR